MLPAPKAGAVAGRLGYGQFLLAGLATAWFAASLVVALAPAARRRAVSFRAVAVGAGVLVPLLAWELVAFALPTRHLMDNPWYLGTGRALTGARDLPFERPPHLAWEGASRGDLAILHGDEDPYQRRVEFRTDFQGFRNPDAAADAELIFLGDSFTEAGNVPESETFVRVVGERLGVSVRNLGRAGYAPPSELVVLEKYGLAGEPRSVIWQVAEANDLDESALFAEWVTAGRPWVQIDPRGQPSRLEGWKRRSPTRRAFDLVREAEPWPMAGSFDAADGETHSIRFLPVAPGPRHTPADHPGWPVLEAALRRGARLLGERGVSLLVVLVPMKLRAMGHQVAFSEGARSLLPVVWDLDAADTLAASLRALCAELGVTFLDLTPLLRERAAAGELVYLPFDTHLSPDGHQIVSEAIAAELSR